MPKIRKILFPTDFSDCSKIARNYAFSFALDQEASLVILHVIEDVYLTEEGWDPLVLNPDLFTQLEERAVKKLEAIVAEARKRKIRATHAIGRGKPFAQIIRFARESKADLLILGTHGRTGLKHVLIGSTAEKVVRKSPIPVLTVRCAKKKFQMP